MSFRDEVYALVKQIPAGKLATYGQLAALCGSPRASRIVGTAMLHAPESLPCHRVVYRDGTLCCEQAFGGKEIQRQMLEAEGVRFLPDGRADLRACQWEGPWPGTRPDPTGFPVQDPLVDVFGGMVEKLK